MLRKLLPLLVSLTAASCGSVFDKETPEPKESNKITQAQVSALLEMKSDIQNWARECGGGIACGTETSGKANDGDSVLWAGLLCLSGDMQQCDAVALSTKSDGSMCRNPDCDREKNSFSRDMMMGYLAYQTKVGNIAHGEAFHDFIIDNGHKLCTDADDNRCNFNHPQYDAGWDLWAKVWRHHDVEPTIHMKAGEKSGGEFITNIQSIVAAEGYPRHLVAVQLMISQKVGNWDIWFQNSADQLLKVQPDNPFFEYVANGKTKKAAQLVLDKCPRDQPIKSNDWAWQRDESEQAWKKAKGWDCIFMANVLTGE